MKKHLKQKGMYFTKNDAAYLASIGYADEDIAQIRKAMWKRYTTYSAEKHIGNTHAVMNNLPREQAIAALGREEYLLGLARSAFHWSAARISNSGWTVYFDSSRLFKAVKRNKEEVA